MHSSFLQLGGIPIPIFGVFAALGLMAGLTLSQRTARYVGLAPEAVWNAGMVSILSAFVISRLLLIGFNLRSFLQYPLLVLALPSLTALGVLITAIFMLGYLRWRKLPLRPVLDAAAPCAALLWAFLSLGEYLGGTRNGMPTPSSTAGSVPRPEPVELWTLLAAFILCGALLALLKWKPNEGGLPAGTVASGGLMIGGLVVFFLDFFHLPSDLLPDAWLDPSQIIGIAMILVGVAFLLRARTRVKRESGTETTHAV